MVDKTQMSGNGRATDQTSATDRLGALTRDIIELLELQTKLFMDDCKEALWHLVLTAVSVLAAIFVFVGSIPLLFAALAHLLVTLLGMPLGWALLVAAVLEILISGGLAFLGWRLLRRAGGVFHRSGREFSRNLIWLKASLKSAPRSRNESESSLKACERPVNTTP
jgi:hypothetical protein